MLTNCPAAAPTRRQRPPPPPCFPSPPTRKPPPPQPSPGPPDPDASAGGLHFVVLPAQRVTRRPTDHRARDERRQLVLHPLRDMPAINVRVFMAHHRRQLVLALAILKQPVVDVHVL